ncbi:MAG: hypothetical protein CSB01_00730 [Bacteroidia bacterium]|nr:MAG: hypothetical protein CSB01_00730 [Bacteroidia bacterium]
MEDFENIIYIIFTLIFLIASAFGKKKPKRGKTTNSVKPLSHIEDDEIETTEYEENYPDEIKQYLESYGAESSLKKELLQEYHEKHVDIEENVTRQIVQTKRDRHFITKEKRKPLIKKFNIKSAIIYKTILERKYFEV